MACFWDFLKLNFSGWWGNRKSFNLRAIHTSSLIYPVPWPLTGHWTGPTHSGPQISILQMLSQHTQAGSSLGGAAQRTTGPCASLVPPTQPSMPASLPRISVVLLQISKTVFCGTRVLGDGNWHFNETWQTNQKTRIPSSKKAASAVSPSLYSGL